MLRGVALPSPEELTPRARSNAYPHFSDAALRLLAEAAERPRPILDAERLIAAARTQTSLSDFGDGPLEEPLDLLCRSLTDEVDLHALGAVYAERQLLGLLSTRLRLMALWRKHPEILEIPVERPIIIIGLHLCRAGLIDLAKCCVRRVHAECHHAHAQARDDQPRIAES